MLLWNPIQSKVKMWSVLCPHFVLWLLTSETGQSSLHSSSSTGYWTQKQDSDLRYVVIVLFLFSCFILSFIRYFVMDFVYGVCDVRIITCGPLALHVCLFTIAYHMHHIFISYFVSSYHPIQSQWPDIDPEFVGWIRDGRFVIFLNMTIWQYLRRQDYAYYES